MLGDSSHFTELNKEMLGEAWEKITDVKLSESD